MVDLIISSELLDQYLEHGCYSSDEKKLFDKIADEIYPSLTKGKSPRHHGQKAELIMFVGPPGSGKSTLMHQQIETMKDADTFVLLDPDHVRRQLPFMQDAIRKNLELGFSLEQADAEAMKEWNAGAIYLTQSLFNRAQREGYNLMRCGTMGGPVTRDVCLRSKKAGYQLDTRIVLAPLSVCQESIQHRIRAGGHPIKENYIEEAFDNITPSMSLLFAKSDHLSFFWRGALNGPASLVAKIDPTGHFDVWDTPSFAAFSRTARIKAGDLISWKNAVPLSSQNKATSTLQ